MANIELRRKSGTELGWLILATSLVLLLRFVFHIISRKQSLVIFYGVVIPLLIVKIIADCRRGILRRVRESSDPV